jgi:putative ABC transport system permease protein
MLITNLKIFLLSITRQKTLTAIKVLGLSIGLASCVLIMLYVVDELGYDSQHHDADRLYRISWRLAGIGSNASTPIPVSSPQVGPLLDLNFNEVESFTRLASKPMHLSVGDNGRQDTALQFVDANFFSFFSFDWVQGTLASALSQPDSIVLTESLARYYFGEADPLGKVVMLQQKQPLTVTGLIRDLKRNTHITGEAFVTMNSLERLLEPGAMDDWFESIFQTYVRVQSGVPFELLRPELHTFLEENLPPAANAIYDPDSITVRAIHLQAANESGQSGYSNRYQDLLALIAVGVALLVVACINFANLTTAHAIARGKEVAVRKVLGASRAQIFRQHFAESLGLMVFSLLLVLGILELSLPLLNAATNKSLSLASIPATGFAIVGLVLLVLLIAGVSVALYLAAFTPTNVFRPATSQHVRGAGVRNLFVVLQFAIAIVLIIGTTVIYRQIQHVNQLELGFTKDQVLVIENELGDHWEAVKQRLQAESRVVSVSAAHARPFKRTATSMSARYEAGDTRGENLSFSMIDSGYFELLEVPLLAGRMLSPHTNLALIVNRAMVEKMHWSIADAVGKRFELNWSTDYSRSVYGNVVGVVENMRVDSLHNEVTPLLYMVPTSLSGLRYALVKIATTDIGSVMQKIETIWRSAYPDQPINQYLLDAKFQALYETEKQQARVVGVFAMLAIFIACMGLFGLATFNTERRTKEIGVRKVMGGSAWSIVLLLTNDFSKLVLLSNVIAWPIAYYAMNRWLENFAYRIDLTPLIFIGSGLIALCIAWVTVGGTAAKAASQKPVLALRYE